MLRFTGNLFLSDLPGKYETTERHHEGECGSTVVESVLTIFNVSGGDAGEVKCVATIYTPKAVTFEKTFNFIVQCKCKNFEKKVSVAPSSVFDNTS